MTILLNLQPFSTGDLVESNEFLGVIWEIEGFKFGVDKECPMAFLLHWWGSDRTPLPKNKDMRLWTLRFRRDAYECPPREIRIPNAMEVLAIASKG
jgi:hypothetical protein